MRSTSLRSTLDLQRTADADREPLHADGEGSSRFEVVGQPANIPLNGRSAQAVAVVAGRRSVLLGGMSRRGKRIYLSAAQDELQGRRTLFAVADYPRIPPRMWSEWLACCTLATAGWAVEPKTHK